MNLIVENIENWNEENATNNWEHGSIWNPYDGCLQAFRTKSRVGNAWLYVCQTNDESVDIILHQEDSSHIFRSGIESRETPVLLSCFFDKKYVTLVGEKKERSHAKLILACKCKTDNLMEHIANCNDLWINFSIYIENSSNKNINLTDRLIWNFDISGDPKLDKVDIRMPYKPYPLSDEEKRKEWNLLRQD